MNFCQIFIYFSDGEAWKPIDNDDWLCLTCREFEDRLCTYASLSIAPEGDFAMLNCLGKSVPYYLSMYLPPINEQTGRQEVIVAGINGGEDYPLMEATSSTNNDLIEVSSGHSTLRPPIKPAC